MDLYRTAGELREWLDGVRARGQRFPREPMTTVSLPAMSTGLHQFEDPAHLDLIALAMCKLWTSPPSRPTR